MGKIYTFPRILSWTQKSTVSFEFFELILIGLIMGIVFSIAIWSEDQIIWYKALLEGLGLAELVIILIFLFWKFARWWWSTKQRVIMFSIISLGLSPIMYLILYSIVWLITYINNKYILSHFYLGEKDLKIQTKFDPFSSAFSKQKEWGL